MRRGLSAAALGLLALGALALGGGLWAESRALNALSERGVSWAVMERQGLAGRTLKEVTWGPLDAGAVWGSLQDPSRVWVFDAELDLRALAGEGGDAGGGLGEGGAPALSGPDLDPAALLARLPAAVVIDDLTVRWGERILLSGLSGEASPAGLELFGDGSKIQAPGESGEVARIRASRTLSSEHLEAELLFDLRIGEATWSVGASASEIALRHPLLSESGRLELDRIRLEGTLDPAARSLGGAVNLGGVEASLLAECADGCALTLDVPDQDAAKVLAPLASLAPEIERAEIGGALGGTLRWSEGGEWSLTPRVEGLIVEGAAALGQFRRGRFTYLVTGADGERRPRESGEGTPGWTPLQQTSDALLQAILAAEDSAYWTHPGYSVEAILEALAANREAGEVVRGGSTLTQQLAKNLFFDGERTLSRKLREVLVAAEMDRSLGKQRVLELYVNVVEWGPDLYGIHDATERYFLKRPARLEPNEAAFLAAILRAPRTEYQRWYLGGRANAPRLAAILQNMADAGWMPPSDARRWSEAPLRFIPPAQ